MSVDIVFIFIFVFKMFFDIIENIPKFKNIPRGRF